MGMRQRPGQGERLLTPLVGLVWVAKQPQGKGCKAPAAYPGIMPAIEKGMGAVLLEVVEGQALLCVLARWIGSFVRGGLRLLPPLRLVDSLGGAFLGAIFGFTLVWVGGAVALQLRDQPEVRKEVRHSQVIRRLNQLATPDDLLRIDVNRARDPLGL